MKVRLFKVKSWKNREIVVLDELVLNRDVEVIKNSDRNRGVEDNGRERVGVIVNELSY